MGRKSKLLTEEVVGMAKSELRKLEKTGGVAIKLRAIISAQSQGITTVAKAFGTTKASLISWIKHIKNGSMSMLAVQKGRGRLSILTSEHKELIKQWMIENKQITINQVRSMIMSKTHIAVSRATVHRAMKGLNFSYITPRPKHYKQASNALTEGKKKSSKSN